MEIGLSFNHVHKKNEPELHLHAQFTSCIKHILSLLQNQVVNLSYKNDDMHMHHTVICGFYTSTIFFHISQMAQFKKINK